jgi:hypothetical protein
VQSEFNMGIDDWVARKQLQLTIERISDIINGKPIETKATTWVVWLQGVKDWTFWKVRPLPKCKEQKTAGEPETLEPLQHSETLTA